MPPLLPILLLAMLLPRDQPNPLIFTDERDGQVYRVVELEGLYWMQENLRFRMEGSVSVDWEMDDQCGEFYDVEAAFRACPEGWRLPTEQEVKRLIKADKRGRIRLADTLAIPLCGRMDNGIHSRPGEQNTYWIAAELEDGSISHWHSFGKEQEIHHHNVVNAHRQFPVRCVCEGLESAD